jgi:hypothetical protein
VQHRELASLGGRGYKGINEGKRSMLATSCEGCLDLQRSSMVSVSSRYCGKRLKSVRHLPVVIGVSGGVAELECDGVAQRDLSSRSKRCKRCGDGGLGQSCEDACVDQISEGRHLLVGTPRPLRVFKVEPTLLAEQGNELQAAPCMDDFVQGGVDRRPQGGRAENRGRLLEDIWINFDRGLRHTMMISNLAGDA